MDLHSAPRLDLSLALWFAQRHLGPRPERPPRTPAAARHVSALDTRGVETRRLHGHGVVSGSETDTARTAQGMHGPLFKFMIRYGDHGLTGKNLK